MKFSGMWFVIYDNIKSHKKPGLQSLNLSLCLSLSFSLEDGFWEKPQVAGGGGVKLTPQTFKD